MRYYLIAGEASGDLHGSNLIKQIHAQDPSAVIRCWGGDKMEMAGATLVKHYKDLAFMGFVEVLKHLPTILKNLRFCKEDIDAFNPDVLVLIDYPGFNLRIAEWAKKQNHKIVYYISPQVWAWKESRVKMIRACVDKMLVVLPFEVAFYKKWNYEAQFVGHPLMEAIEDELQKPVVTLSKKKIIALLPGSRKQEIMLKLPIMLSVMSHFPDYDFWVAAAPSQPIALYKELIGHSGAKLTQLGSYNLLRQASAALVTSGTATLETALFGVPQVVCYKGNALSYQIAKRLIKVKYISLVNLIADKLLVKELIQHELTTDNLVQALQSILNTDNRENLRDEYGRLAQLLGTQKASEIAAKEVIGIAGLRS